jgi:hypothetical protein
MKQIWPNYSYSPATNVLTLTGLNIDRDQLLLVTAADRGRIMYNFADSSVTASAFTSGANTALTLVATTAGLTTTASLVIYYDDQVSGISGTVSASISGAVFSNSSGEGAIPNEAVAIGWVEETGGGSNFNFASKNNPLPISGTVTVGSLPSWSVYDSGNDSLKISINDVGGSAVGTSIPISGTVTANPTGTQTIAGSVTLGAGTAQIGSVTASISGTVPISISSVTVGNSVTIGSLPALAAGTAQIGSVTASISNTVVTFYPLQGTAVSNTNFTSITASTTLVSAVAGRDVLTVFNEGAGNLFISPGATATSISYQVRLSAGDYWECPEGQRSLAHTAVFSTAGTARVTEVS